MSAPVSIASLAMKHLDALQASVATMQTELAQLSDARFAVEIEALRVEIDRSPSNLAGHLLLDIYNLERAGRPSFYKSPIEPAATNG